MPPALVETYKQDAAPVTPARIKAGIQTILNLIAEHGESDGLNALLDRLLSEYERFDQRQARLAAMGLAVAA